MDIQEILPDSTPILPAAPADTRANWQDIPAKGAVYLLATLENEIEKPLLLATVGDLRSALKRRLTELPDLKTKRVAYGTVCTRILWRRVDSSFAANWWYWRAARAFFPDTYAALIPWRSSWWIAVDREGPFPRMRKTIDLADPALAYAGPVRDKHAAARLIETVEDLFDLCRYYNELVQAPHGRACAYKEMGKCPAPCDGTVPIPWYRAQMTDAWSFLSNTDRPAWREKTETHMKAAATRLEFETANRIKQRLTRAQALDAPTFTHVRPLEKFSFLALQPGKGKPWLEPWIIHGTHIEPLPQLHKKDFPTAAPQIVARYAEIAATPIQPPLSTEATEQIGLTTHHLYRGPDDHGIYLPGADLLTQGPQLLLAAAEKILTRKATPKPLIEHSSEGDHHSTEAPVDSPPENPPAQDSGNAPGV